MKAISIRHSTLAAVAVLATASLAASQVVIEPSRPSARVQQQAGRAAVVTPPAESPSNAGFPTPAADQSDPRTQALQAVHELRAKLRSEEDEDREAVKSQLQAALAEYFDRDMEYRQRELGRLRERADETQVKIEQRQAARDELIDLQLKLFQQDADGLGLLSGIREGISISIPALPGSPNSDTLVVRSGFGRSAYATEADGRASRIQQALRGIQEARRRLAQAETEEEEATALEELRAALGSYFDQDLELRRKELGVVREELKRLQSLLQKRAAAKADIVDLQLQMFINEADGLGFFSGGVGPESATPGFGPGFGTRVIHR